MAAWGAFDHCLDGRVPNASFGQMVRRGSEAVIFFFFFLTICDLKSSLFFSCSSGNNPQTFECFWLFYFFLTKNSAEDEEAVKR